MPGQVTIAERVSAVLSQHFDGDTSAAAEDVVAELDLAYEYENGRVMYSTKPPACKPNGLWQQRIVSPHVVYTGE